MSLEACQLARFTAKGSGQPNDKTKFESHPVLSLILSIHFIFIPYLTFIHTYLERERGRKKEVPLPCIIRLGIPILETIHRIHHPLLLPLSRPILFVAVRQQPPPVLLPSSPFSTLWIVPSAQRNAKCLFCLASYIRPTGHKSRAAGGPGNNRQTRLATRGPPVHHPIPFPISVASLPRQTTSQHPSSGPAVGGGAICEGCLLHTGLPTGVRVPTSAFPVPEL